MPYVTCLLTYKGDYMAVSGRSGAEEGGPSFLGNISCVHKIQQLLVVSTTQLMPPNGISWFLLEIICRLNVDCTSVFLVGFSLKQRRVPCQDNKRNCGFTSILAFSKMKIKIWHN